MLPTSRRIASNYWNTRRCGKSTGKKGEEKIASPRKFKLRKKREGKKISKKIYNETYIFTCLFPDVIIYPFIHSFSLSLLLFLQHNKHVQKATCNIIIIFPTFQRLKLSVKRLLLLNIENGFNYLNLARNARRCHCRYFSLKLKIFFKGEKRKKMESSLIRAGHSIKFVEIRISPKITLIKCAMF